MARVYQGSELQKEQIGGYPGVHLPRRPSTLLHISKLGSTTKRGKYFDEAKTPGRLRAGKI